MSCHRTNARSLGVEQVISMAEEWLTYGDLGERLGISSEAARQKAIRYRWRRRTNNHGKAEVLVDLVEVREQMERFPPRKPKADQPSDDRLTPEDQSSDAQTFAALDAHIETLKAMVAKAEALAERERERADNERSRAESERERAERLQARVGELLTERGQLSDQQQQAVRGLEEQIEELRRIMETRAAARRPWWRRLAG
jgi:chromosome segregation ATPase